MKRLQQRLVPHLENLLLRLADPGALWQLALLGLVGGLIAGVVMVAFRLLIEFPQPALFGIDSAEDYENLAPGWRLLLPTLGGLLIGLWLQRLSKASREFGVVHVIEYLTHRDGQLPIKNAGVQFFGAAISIVSGHSVGREGPAIHIGAACGSWIGQQLHLPNNSIRVLVGAGCAGAIAAAFNTPLAGVIFTMEVILAEYTLASFMPIILAAVSATALSRWIFGSEPVFAVPEVPLESLAELAYIVVMGVAIGVLASAFVRLLARCARSLPRMPLWQRLTVAGFLTGVIALAVPEIMGIGYDTVNAALRNELAWTLMLGVLAGKWLATAVGLGLGLPGGVIGPILMMGVLAGSVTGQLLNQWSLVDSSAAFYAMLGMGAMMGATLNAPLAALTALLELTANPHVILPGMLAIVAAGLTSQQLFATPSIFLRQLRLKGLDDPALDPVTQFLRRIGVSLSMDRRVKQIAAHISPADLKTVLETPPTWLLLRDARPQPMLLFTAELINYLEKAPEEQMLELEALPLRKLTAAPISAQATLLGALRKMNAKEAGALYVISPHSGRLLGIITRQDIERSYRSALN